MLEPGDQQELLRHMIERVIIDPVGKVKLDLHAPFAYLRDISEWVRNRAKHSGVKTKTGTANTGLTGSSITSCLAGRAGAQANIPQARIPLIFFIKSHFHTVNP